MTPKENGMLDFGLSEQELEELQESSRNVVCEGGSEGWSG